ncbi:hypothetical protein C8J56DRAFT_813750 [Mycena floridula]|nr:hypothetical protein C8J56DRAFT_813750 [Mycena floridula]
MSLLTPPSTSHREKENRPVASSSRVAWSQNNQYHSLSSPPAPLKTTIISSTRLPAKSILKKSSEPFLPLSELDREITPEPSSPLADATYLDSAVSKIIALENSLPSLIEAYSVLAARLRPCANNVEPGISYPLFEPFRNHRDEFVISITRDLQRALVEPVVVETSATAEGVKLKGSLPSPKSTPRKKKSMTGDEVRYSRDLCSTTLAVLRLLCVMLSLPAIFEIFSDAQLSEILTHVLALPLATELPTLNGRKTCALAILVLQSQRLPSEILFPAKERIVYAIRRGLDGELGKEGKKGSTSDGLRAVHDLVIFQPLTFVPAFAEILSSVLDNLLAPSLVIRVLACHALGGIVSAAVEIPYSPHHVRIAAIASTFLTAPSTRSPSKATSPSTIVESAIVRTLRTTLGSLEPNHVAQGPIWGLTVLSHFICLLGPALTVELKASKVIVSLMQLGLRHRKSTVRALGCMMWRSSIWAFVQPEAHAEHQDPEMNKRSIAGRQTWWTTIKHVLDFGVAPAIVAGLVGNEPIDSYRLACLIDVLKDMTARNKLTFTDAMLSIKQLVNFELDTVEWDSTKLLSPSMLSAYPGLLTSDFTTLEDRSREMLAESPNVSNIRPFSGDELTPDVLEKFVGLWKAGFGMYSHPDAEFATVETLVELVRVHLALSPGFTIDQAALILKDVIKDINNDWETKDSTSSPIKRSPTSPKFPATAASKLALVGSVLKALFNNFLEEPSEARTEFGKQVLSTLMKNEAELTASGSAARVAWVDLCILIILRLEDDSHLDAFWGGEFEQPSVPGWSWAYWQPQHRSLAWDRFARKWDRKTSEGFKILLSVPFSSEHGWEMSNGDLNTWEHLLKQGVDAVIDYESREASFQFLEQIAAHISSRSEPTSTVSGSVADHLLTQLEIQDSNVLPERLLEYVNDSLKSNYPPEPRHRKSFYWLMRTLSQFINECPNELVWDLLELIQDGVSVWFADESNISFSADYSDVLTLNEAIVARLGDLPRNSETLQAFAPLLESIFDNQMYKPDCFFTAFDAIWSSVFADSVPKSEWPEMIRKYFSVTLEEESLVQEASTDSEAYSVPLDEKLDRSPELVLTCISQEEEPEISSNSSAHPQTTPPSTPLKPLTCPSTPPRLHQSFRPAMPLSPLSPSKRQIHRSAPPTMTWPQLGGYPESPLSNKRRRTSDWNKENASPSSLDSSPRYLNSSPTFNLGKRRFSGLEEIRDTKRIKSAEGPSLLGAAAVINPVELPVTISEEDEIATITLTRPETNRPLYAPVPSKKRKRFILDAVEVPSVDDVYRSWDLPRPIAKKSTVRRTVSDVGITALRRTRSGRMSRLPMKYPQFAAPAASTPARISSPEPASSDYEPEIGLVTPHHLISPVLPRSSRCLGDDPPSDDSDMSGSSPSRAAATRLLTRTGSLPRQKYWKTKMDA